jgi:ppGpp synthetase/RelA/SpoT-type nucleotidyltranferase
LFNGKAHDGTIFKQTTSVNPNILVLGDSGYRGIQKVHANTQLPIRHKEDIAKLSEEQKATRKASNKKISSIRMKIEHVIGRVKVFKIIAEKYRNRRKRLLLRFNLICGIVNFERSFL